jgi:crossover junction endodeoxyribonuclease RuvC
MRILGIDPGTHRIGWGIIEKTGSQCVHIACGAIELPPHTESSSYLLALHQGLSKIIAQYQPDLAAVEKLFFQTNIKTASTVSEGRGVILLALAQAGVTYLEFSPNTIKQAVTGDGRADKTAISRMVAILLKLDTKHLLDDTADALAVALTGATHRL